MKEETSPESSALTWGMPKSSMRPLQKNSAGIQPWASAFTGEVTGIRKEKLSAL